MSVMERISDLSVTAGEAPGVVASASRVQAWMLVARRGDEFVYATRVIGTNLPFGSAGAAEVRKLYDLGLVTMFQRRAGEGEVASGWRNYVAKRTAKPVDLRKPRTSCGAERSTGGVAPIDGCAAAADAVMDVLTRRARLSRPCPSATALGELTGMSAAKAEAVLRALHEDGAIILHRAAAPTNRIVTIVATGKRTGTAR